MSIYNNKSSSNIRDDNDYNYHVSGDVVYMMSLLWMMIL